MRTLFTQARIFDGEAFLPQGHAVLVEDGAILSVEPEAAFAGADAQVVAAPGATLTPGLIDCHTHICFGAETEVVSLIGQMTDAQFAARALQNARATLRGGVTSIRDLGGVRHVEITVNAEIRAGRWLGPTILTSGRMICITGGHGWFMGLESDGPEAIRRSVRINAKAGCDVIKIMATGGVMTAGVDPLASYFTPEELFAAVDESRRLGRRVAAHALGAPGIAAAVKAGVSSIEHGFQLDDEIIQAMIAAGVYLVPTLSAIGVAERVAYEGFPASLADRAARYADMQRDSVRRYHRAGGRLAMGTDAGTPLNHHGENAQELGFLAAIGVSPAEALKAGTSAAADLCGLNNRGWIRAGAAADLILVDADLEADIAPITQAARRRLILKDGKDVLRLLPDPARAWAEPLSIHDSPF